MAFTVEDGTGLPNANSYASVAEFDAYTAERGIDITAFDDATEKEQRLVQATDYIDLSFKFKGQKKSYEQALEFPRVNCYVDGRLIPSDSVPTDIKNATIEYAVRSQTAPLFNIPTNDPGGAITQYRTKVGPLERETHYSIGTSASSNKYPPGDNYLASYILLYGASLSYR